MKVLSIFCDESGDFGKYSHHSPAYVLALVMHEQDRNIADEIDRLGHSIDSHGYRQFIPIHTAPLIRREEKYRNLDGQSRRKIFDSLFAFARRCRISYKAIVIEKKLFGDGRALESRIARELGAFIRDNLTYFHSFDRVIVYYDRGQKEISRTIDLVFTSLLSHYEFRTVSPSDYILFQVADLICTIELIERNRINRGLSKSEASFFGGAGSFKKTYLKMLRRHEFDQSGVR